MPRSARTNNFVIPTEDGDLVLHITPGPCSHQEHWIDPLHLGFRDSIRCHTGFHSLVGLFCVLTQLASKSSDFTWYGRGGIGAWTGSMFFVTCLVGSYATHPDLSPKNMRSWLYVYVVFCVVSGFSGASLCVVHALYGNLNILPEWQHGILSLLGAVEFCFCLVEVTLVLYRLCSSPSVPEGFDFHIVVDYASDGEIISSRQLEHVDLPPPSYEQIFRSESIREIIQREGSNIAVMQDERRSVTSITSTGTDIPSRSRYPTDIPLTPIGPHDSTQAMFSHSLNPDTASLS